MSQASNWHEAYIGLGSNLDAPLQQVRTAAREISALPGIREPRLSPLYSSFPVGPQDQPDYINAVMQIRTDRSPLELLRQLQAIENQHGRLRSTRWGARTLDLDLLLYDDLILNEPDLIVPHPELANRSFVLYPLADIAPADLRIAGKGSLTNLLANCAANGIHRIE
ncbi:MAG: 2-amino-4-hydroxy-6-hydroxymethyldihydropteridine diphosphokinase [Methylomonas sp.]|jgi:2-amino-4-hydroxy-6-hydroxymethyldihydropteridine diphosphokinase|uniref:2-amino-4-hydroxy-6- hydroxymethyldihydropteridine diphosphokinase n=1 Tax=Methylomonas sp. TaxID=418 RepID=UPI0025E3FCCD|nr:2-amino-4-hydroxy-6-hydroxymethyldihydropteridine diphosphokinase [Methylomonas sp.]MCK9608873.1 2-amino-4-hydroxy-6-hydroxymethyldihydropteridine diphosphokinase [Methylomonas sp.]